MDKLKIGYFNWILALNWFKITISSPILYVFTSQILTANKSIIHYKRCCSLDCSRDRALYLGTEFEWQMYFYFIKFLWAIRMIPWHRQVQGTWINVICLKKLPIFSFHGDFIKINNIEDVIWFGSTSLFTTSLSIAVNDFIILRELIGNWFVYEATWSCQLHYSRRQRNNEHFIRIVERIYSPPVMMKNKIRFSIRKIATEWFYQISCVLMKRKHQNLDECQYKEIYP